MQSIFVADHSHSSRGGSDREAAARTIKEPSKSRHAPIRCSARHGLDLFASLKLELPNTIFSAPRKIASSRLQIELIEIIRFLRRREPTSL
jgi:hypothetical protein